MNELKPCPFCGGNNATLFVDETRGVCVLCQDCGCRTKYAYDDILNIKRPKNNGTAVKMVTERWNRRASEFMHFEF